MAKSRKIVISIYLGTVFIACTTYLALILIGSLHGNDMSNSVLDTDHRYINHYKEAAKSDTSNGTSNHSLNHSNQNNWLSHTMISQINDDNTFKLITQPKKATSSYLDN